MIVKYSLVVISVLIASSCKPSTKNALQSESLELEVDSLVTPYSKKAYDQKPSTEVDFYDDTIELFVARSGNASLGGEEYTVELLSSMIQYLNKFGEPGQSKKGPTFNKLQGSVSAGSILDKAISRDDLTGEQRGELVLSSLEKKSDELASVIYSLSWKNLLKLFDQTRIARRIKHENPDGESYEYDLGMTDFYSANALKLESYLENLNYSVVAELNHIDYLAEQKDDGTFSYSPFRIRTKEDEKINEKGERELVKDALFYDKQSSGKTFLNSGPQSTFWGQGLGQLAAMGSNGSIVMSYFKMHKPGVNDEAVKSRLSNTLTHWEQSVLSYNVYKITLVRATARLVTYYMHNIKV